MKSLRLILATLSIFSGSSIAADFPPPLTLGDTATYGRNIQRTMKLLEESSAENPNTVRILFYGQSITEQNWSKIVADDLKVRFPHADLIIENRALGGFASNLLEKTAETDLYPFQPDLLIFHVYGAHDKYENIIRRVRERTCAEILIQTDHITNVSNLTEETDPAKAIIQSGQWDSFMNYNFLPSLAAKYGAELCDQRSLWKHYLTDIKLEPQALLRDNIHLNAHGEYLMAEIVKAHLQRNPKFDPAPAETWVKTYVVGKDLTVAEGKLSLAFEGNRIDVICKSTSSLAAQFTIDGRQPFEIPELYSFTPAQTTPPGKWLVKWPIIAPITSEKPLQLEEWTMEITKAAGADEKLFNFNLSGSKTGPDGEGRSDAQFISNSGRISISPEAWNANYSLALAGIKPPPEKFTVKWNVIPLFLDTNKVLSVSDSKKEYTVTLAQGLINGKHQLDISGPTVSLIKAIRIYRPSLATQPDN